MREDFFNKNVLILGYGISGKGAERALKACGANVTVLDESSRAADLSAEFVSRFDLVITSPSVLSTHSVYRFAEQARVEIYGEIELGAKLYVGIMVGITGTNGKTTTTGLLGEILKRAKIATSVCGNIGRSFAEAAVFDDSAAAVVELSSFQLERIHFLKPRIAIITNITPDHLDRHGTLEAYAAAKRNIAKFQTAEDTLILSQDDIPIGALENFRPQSEVLYVSTRGKVRGTYLQNGTVYHLGEPVMKRSAIKLSGEHNVTNCLFAVCAAKLLNVPDSVIVETLSEFKTEDHRLKFVGRVKGKCYYNDSKGTNIGATRVACRAMPGSSALILGGKDKGYEFDALFESLPETVKYIYVIGETAEKIKSAAFRNSFFEIEKKDSLREAVLAAAETDAENVLLSPATSSFDMFKDYEDRGRQFEAIVKELEKDNGKS